MPSMRRNNEYLEMEYQACNSRPVEKILHQNKVLIHSKVKTARYTTCYTPMVLHTEQSHSKKHYQLIICILLSTNIAAWNQKNMWHYKSDQQQCLSSACTKAFGLFSNPRFQTMEHYNIWYPDKLQLHNQELQQGSGSNTDIKEGAANTLVLQSLEYQVMVLAANFVHLFMIWSAGHHLGKLRQHKTSITKISNSSAPRD